MKACETTDRNIELGKASKLNIDLPWLTEKQGSDGTVAHPVTGSSVRLCLSDTFHQSNSKRQDSVLRQTNIIQQLRGRINTQTEEQMLSQTGKDNYFVNMMGSTNHIFVERSLLDDMNIKKNNKALTELEHLLQQQLSISSISTLVIEAPERGENKEMKKDAVIDYSQKEDTKEKHVNMDNTQKTDVRQSNRADNPTLNDQLLSDLSSLGRYNL